MWCCVPFWSHDLKTHIKEKHGWNVWKCIVQILIKASLYEAEMYSHLHGLPAHCVTHTYYAHIQPNPQNVSLLKLVGGSITTKQCCTLYGQQLCLRCFQWLMLVQGEMYFWFSKFLCNTSGLSLRWVWVHSCNVWLGFVDIQGHQTRNTNESVHLNIQSTKVHVRASDTGACSQKSHEKKHVFLFSSFLSFEPEQTCLDLLTRTCVHMHT